MTEAKSGPLSGWLRPLFYLGRNRVSQIGVGLTTSAAVTLVGFWLFETMNESPAPQHGGRTADERRGSAGTLRP